MKNIYKFAILWAAAVLFAAIAIAPAGAQLVPMAYGFPSVFHNAETTAFSHDVQAATDNENVFVSFAPAVASCLDGCGVGGLALGLPTIVQTVDKTMYAEHTDYYHSDETDAFNCPYLSVGGAPYGCGGCLPYGLPYGGGYC